MPVPLAVAAPATVAAAAYVNAKASVWYDALLLQSNVVTSSRILWRLFRDRLNLFYLLEDWALSSSHAAKPLLLFEGRSWSYADVYGRALRYGSWLRSRHGVRPKEIVAVNFQNCEDFIFLWFALWSIGAKPAFINFNLQGAALAHCVNAATARLCIVDPSVAANVEDDVVRQQTGGKVDFFVFTPEAVAEAAASPPDRAPDSDRSEDKFSNMAILIFTSGTTGLPKPAVVSFAKCIAAGTVAQYVIGFRGDDVVYTSMPLYHSAASCMSFLTVLCTGCTQALGKRFSTRSFWDEVESSRATMVQYVGETLRYLLAAPPRRDPDTGEDLDRRHRVRVAFGNGLRPDVWDRFKNRFGIDTLAELYTATEGTFATFNVSSNDYSRGAIGRHGWFFTNLMRRDVALVEVDWTTDEPARDPASGFCRKVRPGEPGEMLFQLPPDDIHTRFQGYFNNPEATGKKILRGVFAEGDAYFRTGDVVRWTSDGLVYFHDRIGDTFRWKSENVSTAEVSEAVGTHPAVAEANVYGVELPHHDGRAGCAAVSLSSHQPLDDTLRSLAEHVRTALPRFAVPLFLRVVDGDPGSAQTTGTMKQQKHLLRTAGVRPDSAKDQELGRLYWLSSDGYVPFQEKDWKELEGGRIKL